MKFSLIALLSFLVSSTAMAGIANYCGEIKRLRTWVNGGDTYGVWVEYKANPAPCSG